MVRNVMRKFDVPLKEHDWEKKLCVGVNNIASSKKFNGRLPLEISKEHTQDISKFRFNLWDPTWYFKNSKDLEKLWQPAIIMMFAHSTGDKVCYYIEKEGKKKNYLNISVIWTRCRHIGINKEYTNEKPKQAP